MLSWTALHESQFLKPRNKRNWLPQPATSQVPNKSCSLCETWSRKEQLLRAKAGGQGCPRSERWTRTGRNGLQASGPVSAVSAILKFHRFSQQNCCKWLEKRK